jgi:hypothetical protein
MWRRQPPKGTYKDMYFFVFKRLADPPHLSQPRNCASWWARTQPVSPTICGRGGRTLWLSLGTLAGCVLQRKVSAHLAPSLSIVPYPLPLPWRYDRYTLTPCFCSSPSLGVTCHCDCSSTYITPIRSRSINTSGTHSKPYFTMSSEADLCLTLKTYHPVVWVHNSDQPSSVALLYVRLHLLT